MKRLIVIPLSLLIFSCCSYHCGKVKSDKIIRPENPKIAAYWTSPTMSEEEADSLSYFHLVIADMENKINNPKSLAILKGNGVKLLCYSNPMELFDEHTLSNRPLQREIFQQVTDQRDAYWLKQPNGAPVVFWQGMKMLNLSSQCPKVKGQSYVEYLSQFMVEKVLYDTIWDGYFMDNSGGNVSWIGSYGQNHGIDADNDGQNDPADQLDSVWYEGVHEYLSYFKAKKGDKFIMVGNKGSLDFLDIFSGKMFEEFPCDYLGDKRAGGWYQCLQNYSSTGPYSIIQAKQRPNDPEYRIYILASALLGDGYYAYAQDFYRDFPEYQKDLGKALSAASDSGDFWERKYTHATVRVWPEQEKGEIKYY